MSLNIKYGRCKGECSEEEKAIYCKGFCEYCYWDDRRESSKIKRKQSGKTKDNKRYKISPISKKGRKIAKDDSDFFHEIWEEREHYSEVSGLPLGNVYHVVFFSHVITKGAYPKARHWKENIVLMTCNEHQEWEFGDRSKPEFKKKFKNVLKKYSELVERYYN